LADGEERFEKKSKKSVEQKGQIREKKDEQGGNLDAKQYRANGLYYSRTYYLGALEDIQ